MPRDFNAPFNSKSFCCLCLKNDKPLFNSLKYRGEPGINLVDDAYKLFNVKISKGPGIPNMVCTGCVQMIKNWHACKNNAIKNNRIVKKKMEEQNKATESK